MGELEGKTVIIGGVGPGLGRETALVVFREGANVVLAARTKANLDAVAEEVDKSGERVATVVADISKPEDCQRLVDTAVERFGRIDGLVNCAAMSPMGGLQNAGDFSEWRATFDVNVFGTMQLILLALDQLKEHHGAVVIVSSQTQHHPPPLALQIAYASSKGALNGAMRHLALEVGRDGVRINEVAPGWMYGPPIEGFLQYEGSKRGVPAEEVMAELTARMPLGRMATDGEVAETIGFFLSDRAGGITGQTVMVNAGEIMH
jgi:NAD(P)-dependent dehydrogenase (short-subunit alcohol dehydrogenase family)